jgi:hypothetical protein
MCIQNISSEIIRDVIVSLSAIITSIAALSGLTLWRQKLKGKASFDIARRIIVTSNLFRSEITTIRQIKYLREEFQEGVKEYESFQDVFSDTSNQKNTYAILWPQLFDAFRDLKVACYEGGSIWDEDFTPELDMLDGLIATLQFNINLYVNGFLSEQVDFNEMVRGTVFSTYSKPSGKEDTFKAAIEKNLNKIENIASIKLKEKGA